MTRIGCRAHDYGKLPAARACCHVACQRVQRRPACHAARIAGIEDFPTSPINSLQRSEQRLSAQDVEISVLSLLIRICLPPMRTPAAPLSIP